MRNLFRSYGKLQLWLLAFGFAPIFAGSRIPLWFEPNQGQVHPSVQFITQSAYLGSTRLAIHSGGDKPVVMELIGVRKDMRAEGLDLQPGISSYFVGNDASKWHPGIPHFARVRYRDVYPGIDLIYYGNDDGQLEYDFVLSPGANPERIQISYNQPVKEDSSGDLLIAGVRQKRPKVYQDGHEIAACYRLGAKGRIGLRLARYDRSRELRVDPTLVYSTYFGGPGYESGVAIAIDSSDNAYITGYALAPLEPSLNPFQQTAGYFELAYVAKFAPTGNQLLYATFIGATNEAGTGLAVDASGAAWVTGITHSVNFPTKNPFQATYGGGYSDGFVSEVSPDGSSLLFSSYLGGMSTDTAVAIALDPAGSAYIALQTFSFGLPVGSNAFQQYNKGGANGYIIKLAPSGTTIVWGTYLGGSASTWPAGIAVDGSGHAFVVGLDDSLDFPVTQGAYLVNNPSAQGSAFVTKLEADGSGLVYSTYLGGTSWTGGDAVAIDSVGDAFVAGMVGGPDFPTKNAIQAAYGGGPVDDFVAELTPDGSALVFSTFLGGSNNEYSCCGLALGPDGSTYVGGNTTSPDFPVKNSIQPFKPPVATPLNGNAYLVQLAPGGSTLVFSTFFGGSNRDGISGVAVDSAGNMFVTGTTTSSDFPTKNAYQSTYGGANDAFLARFAPDALPQSPFAASPAILSFQYVIGGAVPAAQTIAVTSATQGQAFTPTTTANWLTISSSATTAPATITVAVNLASLTAGQYSGTVQINALTSVQVNVTVFNPAPVVTSVSPSFVAIGSDSTLTVTGSGFVNGAVVETGSSSTPFTTTFVNATTLQFVIPQALAASAYTLSLVVTNPLSVPSQAFQVEIGTPAPQINAVTNAASYNSAAVAPGEVITVFGTAMGPTTGTAGLSKMLSNVELLFDGNPAPLLYVQAGQISGIVPYEVAGHADTQVIVKYDGQQSAAFTLPVAPSAPALFTDDASGKGQGAILNRDGSLNSSSHPAEAGSVVVLYGTGAGQTNPPGVDGQITGSTLSKPVLPVTATIDGQPAQVLYAGSGFRA
jgi:uncharacterized protein (TIGR03437 family)